LCFNWYGKQTIDILTDGLSYARYGTATMALGPSGKTKAGKKRYIEAPIICFYCWDISDGE